MAIKKSMEALNTFLNREDLQGKSLKTIVSMDEYVTLVEAGKGGFTGENSFVMDGQTKVGRVCALTGAVFAFNNDDKAESFYYKNGSYMIGAEIVKANERKRFDDQKETELLDVEAQMLEGAINPKEWKEQTSAITAREFKFVLSDEKKAELISTFGGYPTKEAFLEARTNGDTPSFVDFHEATEALRAEYVKPTVETTEDEAEEEVA